ncbi:MAG TPA: ATP-grasp domain-containing protein [Gemmatimonadales bacterium]
MPGTHVKVAVVFDTPYVDWEHEDFVRQAQKGVEEAEYEIMAALLERGHDVRMVGVRDDLARLLERLRSFAPDMVFNCAEGYHQDTGLDYLFPALFEADGYRYTGSPPLALLTTRNKAMSKKVLAFHGITVPGFATYRLDETVSRAPELRFPLIVKPLQEDASLGISGASMVWDATALAERVAFVHERFTQPAIAEEFVDGRELYVGLIGNGDDVTVLPIVEMVFDKRRTKPEERIATRLAKWDAGYRERKGIRNIFARPIARATKARLSEICRTAYRALWLRDYARLDVRLAADGEIWVIEANANPFISYGHDLANAAEKVGMSYGAFIERILHEAVKRYGRQA